MRKKDINFHTISDSKVDEQPEFGQNGEEMENSLEVDPTYQMQSKAYTAEVRQKAKHVLSLFKTCHTKLQDSGKSVMAENTQGSMAISEKAASETAAGLDSCKTCGKRDYSLLYCDTCDPVSLHHAGCMTFIEGLAKYHCNDCYYRGLEEPTTELGATSMSSVMENGKSEDHMIKSIPQTEEGEQGEKDIKDQSEMSMSSS